MKRRRFLSGGARAAAGIALAPSLRAQTNPAFDLVIRSGEILDGTGALVVEKGSHTGNRPGKVLRRA